jgi:multiple sugar transport system ATP-binding protein
MTNIDMLLDRYPSQLSGGQQQRVAVARAIAVSPDIFLMDEPLSNLDAKLRVSMRTELKAIHDMTDATTVFVTHDQSEAMSMADRIVIMKDGEVIQVGTPDEVYHHSASIFVADFIGTPPTNFMNVEASSENGDLIIKNQYINLRLNRIQAKILDGYVNKKIIMGIRPENIEIINSGVADMSAPCLVSEPQGSHQIVAIQLEKKIMKIVAPATPKIEPGEIVQARFKQNTLRFFDPDSGLALEFSE